VGVSSDLWLEECLASRAQQYLPASECSPKFETSPIPAHVAVPRLSTRSGSLLPTEDPRPPELRSSRQLFTRARSLQQEKLL
jgi:hypothetical protein